MTDARIPMMGRGVDVASPLAALSQGMAEKQRYDQEQAIAQEDKTYNRARQEKLDLAQLANLDLSNQETRLKIKNAVDAGMDADQKRQMLDIGKTAMMLEPLLDAKKYDEAGQMLMRLEADHTARAAKGEAVDVDTIKEARQMLMSDPETLNLHVKSLIKIGQASDILKPITGENKLTVIPMGSKAIDASGNVVAEGNAKPPAGMRAVTGPDGEISYVPGKALPTSAAQGILTNRDNLRKAETALNLIQGNTITDKRGITKVGDKEATGWKGFASENILQRTDPSGVDTRAAIADLGSMIIHDRSGAAVTASEYPRLKPFIPKETDSAPTVEKKLNRFISEFRAINDEAENFYGETGYSVPPMLESGDVITNPSDQPNGADGWATTKSGVKYRIKQ